MVPLFQFTRESYSGLLENTKPTGILSMDIFADTADTGIIRELANYDLISGVTTNPTLIAQSGKNHEKVIKEICKILPYCPISAEVLATDAKKMVDEGMRLASLGDNVVVKVPLTKDGLRACSSLRRRGAGVNVTLCFNVAQAIMAANADASYISPFIGRLEDIGVNGIQLIREISTIYEAQCFETKVLAASIRTIYHVGQCAFAGANAATLPPAMIRQIVENPLTEKGLATFLADAAKSKS